MTINAIPRVMHRGMTEHKNVCFVFLLGQDEQVDVNYGYFILHHIVPITNPSILYNLCNYSAEHWT